MSQVFTQLHPLSSIFMNTPLERYDWGGCNIPILPSNLTDLASVFRRLCEWWLNGSVDK